MVVFARYNTIHWAIKCGIIIALNVEWSVESDMEKREVESSVIGAVGHSRVLEIEFESGRIYQYFHVPKNIYTAMLNAPSKGKYFNANIRGKFPYQEIELKKRVPAATQK